MEGEEGGKKEVTTNLERLLGHGFVHGEELVLVLDARDLEQGQAVGLLGR